MNRDAEVERLIIKVVGFQPESWSEAMALINLAIEQYKIDTDRQRICAEVMRRLEESQ